MLEPRPQEEGPVPQTPCSALGLILVVSFGLLNWFWFELWGALAARCPCGAGRPGCREAVASGAHARLPQGHPCAEGQPTGPSVPRSPWG